MDEYGVTGARAEIELTVDVPRERLWARITDVTRIGEWSPECIHGEWLYGRTGPEGGALFVARNRYPNGDVRGVVCRVTEVGQPQTFGWAVLDDRGDANRPASIWRYELLPGEAADRTFVRHSFEHGPGISGVRDGVENDPVRGAGQLKGRLGQLRRNMTATIEAMVRDINATANVE